MDKKKIENEIMSKINNIEQLSADMRYDVNNDNYDLEVKLSSIEYWVKKIRQDLKKVEKK